MKKILAFVTAIALFSFILPVGSIQAATNSTAPDYIKTIKPEYPTGQGSNSSFKVNKNLPIYKLVNGAFVKNNVSVINGSTWTIQNTIITNSGAMYYQIANNRFIQSNLSDMSIIIPMTIYMQTNK
ncbi:hypothetical protein [Companilactobacillus ginsenosidimutans]|uniref:Surface layer protein A domain-containing protein n=1 Tax=Companilactobacillus ginsenosidimutans TaxID=1007676 RepID=A0A0H4QHT7_9LACO|nr:hypothetical protein [Companilactobacillus ginsenosidimutans]AKP67959.1 hypothetical protein ABM34_10740 [Companilactobacillus ginsenosidimutans]